MIIPPTVLKHSCTNHRPAGHPYCWALIVHVESWTVILSEFCPHLTDCIQIWRQCKPSNLPFWYPSLSGCEYYVNAVVLCTMSQKPWWAREWEKKRDMVHNPHQPPLLLILLPFLSHYLSLFVACCHCLLQYIHSVLFNTCVACPLFMFWPLPSMHFFQGYQLFDSTTLETHTQTQFLFSRAMCLPALKAPPHPFSALPSQISSRLGS